mmetsp:Transcript_15985/g.25801  ORF Transcript_15985/g.25801 Transcript_15985/m.25801 type:complete len:140 (+) Transcript_15985:316-735(+)
MSIRGIFQLLKLNVSYCSHDGSSRGMRAFIDGGFLQEFADKYPHVEVVPVAKRGHHPFLHGEFRRGKVKHVDLRKKTPSEIAFQMHYMFSEKGGGSTNSIKGSKKHTSTPSVQGVWRPGMWDTPRSPAPTGDLPAPADN